jgi:two-component system, sensor histidine kinase and response regulator
MISNIETVRILVVDDLPDNLSLLKTLLGFEGYQVDVAQDGYTAIAKIEATPPDLILLDVMMPGLDGCEVAYYLWQDSRFKSIPIWLVTGCYDASTLHQHTNNVKGVLRKPLDFDALLTGIRSSLKLQPSVPKSTLGYR